MGNVLTQKQTRWIKNGCIAIILVDVFSGFSDKHSMLGLAIAIVPAIVVVYIKFKETPDEEELEEPELDEPENPHYLTVAELIARLELIGDQTNVVVDSSGFPITSISSLGDEDYGCATWLRGSPNGRRFYRASKGEKNG